MAIGVSPQRISSAKVKITHLKDILHQLLVCCLTGVPVSSPGRPRRQPRQYLSTFIVRLALRKACLRRSPNVASLRVDVSWHIRVVKFPAEQPPVMANGTHAKVIAAMIHQRQDALGAGVEFSNVRNTKSFL